MRNLFFATAMYAWAVALIGGVVYDSDHVFWSALIVQLVAVAGMFASDE